MDNGWNVIERFLREHAEYVPKRGKNISTIDQVRNQYMNGMAAIAPKAPTTVPDQVVDIVLHEYFGIQSSKLPEAVQLHSLSMAAENAVGDLLERYLAKELEAFGWVWCAGSSVRSVDFIRHNSYDWLLLQVKNRDNSENSSSSAIRDGTSIQKWFRTFARTGKTNWEAFPDTRAAAVLSETAFREFAVAYLNSIK